MYRITMVDLLLYRAGRRVITSSNLEGDPCPPALPPVSMGVSHKIFVGLDT